MTNMFKFSIIAVFFVISTLSLLRPADARDSRLLCAALAFTVAADYFLIIERSYEAGLVAFICAQTVYNIRYGGIKVRYVPVICAAFFALGYIVLGLSALFSLALVYAVLFGFSLAAAVRCFADRAYPFPNGCLVLAGMVSYAVCDVFVALHNSGTAFAWAHQNRIVFLIWLFYIPGKFMLSISGISFSSKRNINFMESS